jgi:N-acetyl-gamma-glutamylphosphate reductase
VPDPAVIASAVRVAFLAVPHTAALDIAPALLEAHVTVIDASADFRIKDAAVYERGTASLTQHANCLPRRSTAFPNSTVRAAGRAPRRLSRLLPDRRPARSRSRARQRYRHPTNV